MALTERQQQITDLLDQGKTPRQIAKALKITENAVYQHARRIKQANGSASKPRRKATTRKATTARRKPARKTRTRTTTTKPAGGKLGTIRPTTPLQAIRARREEIGSGLRELLAGREEAQKALDAATKLYEDAHAKQSAELLQLDRAEEALTGKSRTTKPRRKSSRKGTGTVKAPEPVTPDPESEANLATAQAEAAQANGHPAPAPAENPQAALDAGAEFEDIAVAAETLEAEPVGVAEEGGFEQPSDGFGDDDE